MTQSIVCIVPLESQAERIIDSLRTAGFANSDISVLMPDTVGVRDVGHEKHSKAPEGAAVGGAAGAVVGGALGWLAGICALAIPGVGPFVAAGPIMAALGGAAIGSATGGVTGSLIGLGIPEIEAKVYEDRLRDGNVLLCVHTESGEQIKRAEEIFKANNAKDVKRMSETKAPAR